MAEAPEISVVEYSFAEMPSDVCGNNIERSLRDKTAIEFSACFFPLCVNIRRIRTVEPSDSSHWTFFIGSHKTSVELRVRSYTAMPEHIISALCSQALLGRLEGRDATHLVVVVHIPASI